METTKEHLSAMQGRIHALTAVCTALLASHPNGPQIMALARLREIAKIDPKAHPHQKAYVAGFLEVVTDFETGMKIAAEAAAAQGGNS